MPQMVENPLLKLYTKFLNSSDIDSFVCNTLEVILNKDIFNNKTQSTTNFNFAFENKYWKSLFIEFDGKIPTSATSQLQNMIFEVIFIIFFF